jgi:hypothetical protein
MPSSQAQSSDDVCPVLPAPFSGEQTHPVVPGE